MHLKFRRGAKALAVCFIIHILSSQYFADGRNIKRFSIFDPLGLGFFQGTTSTPPPPTTTVDSSWWSLFGSRTTAPPSVVNKFPPQILEDRCKAPLKHFISGLVQKIAGKLVTYEPMVTETAAKLQAEMAGQITDTIIETGLREGNIAGITSEIVGAQFRMVPFVGDKMAAIAQPFTLKSTTLVLEQLCNMLNCCFH